MKRTPIALSFLCLLLWACTPAPTISGVSLTSLPAAASGLLTIQINQPATLTATVTGTGAFNPAVTWSLSPDDGSLVWSGTKATFKPKSANAYTLSASSQADPTKRASLIVTVIVPDVLVNADPTTINPNQPSSLTASVKDIGGAVTWSVSPSAGTSLTPPTPGNTASFTSSQTGTYTITATSVNNPNFQGSVTVEVVPWAGSRLVGTKDDDTITSSATDESNNVYVAGFTTTRFSGAGGFDAFVAKYDAGGSQVWLKQLGSSKDDLAYGVAVDASGNVYVVGTTSGVLPSASGSGNDDAFIAKYSAVGARQWVSQFGTGGFENAFGVTVGAGGNVFVVGDTDGSFSGATNPDPGNADAFVTRIDPSNGARLWTKQLGSIGNDTAYGIAVDANGNADIGGSTEGALSGSSSGLKDAFIAQYTPSGTQTWVKQFGSSNPDEIKAVAVDGSGNIFVAGQMDMSLTITNSDPGDAFVAKYSSSGARAWLSQFGSSADDVASGIAVDANGNAYVSGQTDGSLPDNTSAGSTDAFLTKFDGNGARQWIKQIGTASTDVGFAASIADRGSNVILSGYTEGDPFDGLTGAGGREGFIAKYKLDGSR